MSHQGAGGHDSGRVAAIELGHAGNIGAHGMTDFRDSPGATCRFALPLAWSRGETWIQVRPPVMFARTRPTASIASSWVGGPSSLTPDHATGAWLRRGDRAKPSAPSRRTTGRAPFDGRGPGTALLSRLRNLSRHSRSLLVRPDRTAGEEPRLAGQAEYQIANYAIAVRDRGGTQPVGVDPGCQLPS